ncbi:MAG: proline--tRNA ligase [Candidatus Omnitrophica bacterium]|nr:proline--tRNA ligase [Candidatus Omnitrophota bacterium]
MYWTKDFIPTLRQTPQEAETISHQLMLRAGLVRMLMAGVYTYLPLGLKVLNNVENIIRQEMEASGARELLLPALQPLELWAKTGRDKLLGEVMIKFTDRRGRNVCLGPTHEEVITDLVKNYVSSYRQLPLILYQIQTKFRDEIRPRFGLVRSCEFVMKDAYSFDADQEGLDKNYRVMLQSYITIFKRCGLNVLVVEADSGVMGGSVSHEFMVLAKEGEDMVFVCLKCNQAKPFKEGKTENCPKCNSEMEKINTLEIGHIFQLGTKYSVSLGANFLDAKGEQKPAIMGCYGIGVSRLIPAIIEQNNDKDGIIWPVGVAPYQVIVSALDVTDENIMAKAKELYDSLRVLRINVLFDDRDERAGVKFKDADLLGVPVLVVVGRDSIKNNTVELKFSKDKEKIIGSKEEVLEKIKGFLNG